MRQVGRLVTAAVLVTVMTLLGACAGEETPDAETDATSTPTAEDSPETTAEPTQEPTETEPTAEPGEASNPIRITIESGAVTPNGERLRVERGQTLHFLVTADQDGEFHVHSTPEQTLTFEAGSTELQLTIDRPGVADMELHDPALTVLQLEVR
ncbi:hypothetical protein [Nocardioides sp.]|uniref:hypothetical protein n=1 Tax=Nocardioides sp. TaxID=35761 RepID=UPI002736C3AD|nr:hypothetical protein [Nocardioides sp.]MDP3891703.1 hypothetical protein [Nocardioides sp.]